MWIAGQLHFSRRYPLTFQLDVLARSRQIPFIYVLLNTECSIWIQCSWRADTKNNYSVKSIYSVCDFNTSPMMQFLKICFDFRGWEAGIRQHRITKLQNSQTFQGMCFWKEDRFFCPFTDVAKSVSLLFSLRQSCHYSDSNKGCSITSSSH